MDATPQRVVIAGASGFIGRALSDFFTAKGTTVTQLRRATQGKGSWDPATGRLDEGILATADAVICLSGASLVGRPWTREYKKTLLRSRVDSARTIVDAIGRLSPEERPGTLVCSSAVGIYGANCGDQPLTEQAPLGRDFLAGLCQRWEATARHAQTDHGVRTVNLRTGLVMSAHGGMMQKLLPAYRWGVGAQLGDGCQWMPLISVHDCLRVFEHVITTQDISGPVNMCAPEPVRNADFHQILCQVLRRPGFFRVPSWLLRGVGGEFAHQTLLASQRAIPQVLMNTGFEFTSPHVDSIVREVLTGR